VRSIFKRALQYGKRPPARDGYCPGASEYEPQIESDRPFSFRGSPSVLLEVIRSFIAVELSATAIPLCGHGLIDELQISV